MKCNFCVDFFMLCPPKKNLEVNLRYHINGLKYSKAVDEHFNKGGGLAILSER